MKSYKFISIIIVCLVCWLLASCSTTSKFINPIPLVHGLEKQDNSILYNQTFWVEGNRVIQIWKVDEHVIGEKETSARDTIRLDEFPTIFFFSRKHLIVPPGEHNIEISYVKLPVLRLKSIYKLC